MLENTVGRGFGCNAAPDLNLKRRVQNMGNPSRIKLIQILVIVVLGIFLDQWTKEIACERLATQRHGHFSQSIHLSVPKEFDGKSLGEYLAVEFESNTATEIETIARSTVQPSTGIRLHKDRVVETGMDLEVQWREIVIIPGYWDYQYTENKGAAFSFLADSKSPYRKPFFVTVSLVAVILILWMLSGLALSQQLMIWALSLVCSGAIGNLIDRAEKGYVVDFIVWKYTDAYRWPTFNIADSLICIGVGLMVIEMIRDTIRNGRGDGPSEDSATAPAGSD
jgi:signal peptidase II